jgi:hypothetical protein
MDKVVFWSAIAGAIPGILASAVSIYLTFAVNRFLENFKSNLERDIVKFSKWHEKRVEASVAIYIAFQKYLDFLRRALYWKHERFDVSPYARF